VRGEQVGGCDGPWAGVVGAWRRARGQHLLGSSRVGGY
jgi:hypothetical protein